MELVKRWQGETIHGRETVFKNVTTRAPGMKNESKPKSFKGIECPNCGCRHFLTTHTEPLRDGRIRRRKVCRHCGRKVLTHEVQLSNSTESLNGKGRWQ